MVREVGRKAYFMAIHQISLLSDTPLTAGFDYPCPPAPPPRPACRVLCPVRNHTTGFSSLPAAHDFKNAKW